MCPACLAAAAWAVAGTTSAGGLTVFVASKLRGRKPRLRSDAPAPAPAPTGPESPRQERSRP
ncbi:hypothetical protein [Povalibacter sp.]|uniref:hypothetical protein n=1 Tax=Povalibacter sp. TaxID=1962978 RepID=UPI002F424137